MINCILPTEMKDDFRKMCKTKKITMNAFIKSCILTFTYPEKVEGFDDIIKYISGYTQKDRKNNVYNNEESPLVKINRKEIG